MQVQEVNFQKSLNCLTLGIYIFFLQTFFSQWGRGIIIMAMTDAEQTSKQATNQTPPPKKKKIMGGGGEGNCTPVPRGATPLPYPIMYCHLTTNTQQHHYHYHTTPHQVNNANTSTILAKCLAEHRASPKNDTQRGGGGGGALTHFSDRNLLLHNGVGVLSSSPYVTELTSQRRKRRGKKAKTIGGGEFTPATPQTPCLITKCNAFSLIKTLLIT